MGACCSCCGCFRVCPCCFKCLCWPCCRLHPDDFREDHARELLLQEAVEEVKHKDDERLDMILNREFEYVLVFDVGNAETYNSIMTDRKRTLFEYMDLPDTAPNEASFTAKTGDNKAIVFRKFLNITVAHLHANGFHVKVMTKKDLPGDVLSELKDQYIFVRVGLTEAGYRNWAAQTEFRLEIDPLMAVEWLRLQGDKLAEATISEDPERGMLTQIENWEHLYVAYYKGTPQQIFKNREILWADDPRMGDWSMFRSTDKIKLIRSQIEAPDEAGGADIDMDGLVHCEDHPLFCHYPLHVKDREQQLYDKIWHSWFEIPVDEIREYYGEYVAIYFAFLQYLNYALLFPTLIGTTIFVLQLIDNEINNKWSVFLGVSMVFWGQIVIEGWKYKEYQLQKRWGQNGFKKDPIPRPEFEGEWIYSPIDGRLVPYFDPLEAHQRLCISYSVVGFCIALLFANIVAIASLRIAIDKNVSEDSNWQPTAFGVFSAIQIIIFDTVYTIVALALNDWENHRTDLEYENNLILKNFIFRFINSYNALFYVAFAKFYVDSCEGRPEDGCFDELRISLATIFGTQIIVGNLTEVVVPYILSGSSVVRDQSEVYDQFKRAEYDGTFEDFSEIILQFGYATIFIIAFPLASILALFSFLVEIQVDAFKFHKLVRRPQPQGTSSIFPWTLILSVMGWISTIANLVIIFILFRSFEGLVGMSEISVRNLILLGILIEHFIVFVFLIVIPQWNAQPDDITRHYRRQEHIENALKRASNNLHGELMGWADWSRREFTNYLKSDGLRSHEKAIDALENVDGKALQNIKSKSTLRGKYGLKKKDAKWAWGIIKELTAADAKEERVETFKRLAKLQKFANKKKGRIEEDTRTAREIYRTFSFFDYAHWVSTLRELDIKRIWRALNTYGYSKVRFEMTDTMRAREADTRARQEWVGEELDPFEEYRSELRPEFSDEEGYEYDDEDEEDDDTDEIDAEKENEAPNIEGEETPEVTEEVKDIPFIPAMQAIEPLAELTISWYLRVTYPNAHFRIRDDEQKEIVRRVKQYVELKWEEYEKGEKFTRHDFDFFSDRVKELDWMNHAELAITMKRREKEMRGEGESEEDSHSDEYDLVGHLEADVSVDMWFPKDPVILDDYSENNFANAEDSEEV